MRILQSRQLSLLKSIETNTMSHHRSYEETYRDVPKGKSNEKQVVNDQPEDSVNVKFGDHIKERKTQERPIEGDGDRLDRHDAVGSLDKRDKAVVHDVLLGAQDEKGKGGMPYIQ